MSARLKKDDALMDGILGAIGNTPLVKIRSLSHATGCEVIRHDTRPNADLLWSDVFSFHVEQPGN